MEEEKEECAHQLVVPYCMDCDEFVYPIPAGGWSEDPHQDKFTLLIQLADEKSGMVWEAQLAGEHGANWEEYVTPGHEKLVKHIRVSVYRNGGVA